MGTRLKATGGALIVMAVLLATIQGNGGPGVTPTPTPTPTATPGSSDFNLAVKQGTNGVDCDSTPTREGTPFAYGDAPLSATACTLDQASDAASCSDRVAVLSSTLTNGLVTGNRSCSGWTVGAEYGVTCSGCVSFEPAGVSTVTVDDTLETQADWTSFEGFRLSNDSWEVEGSDVHHVLMTDLRLSGTGGKMFRFTSTGTAASDIAWVGGEMDGAATGGNEPVYVLHMTRFTVDGVHFHDLVRSPVGDHMEVIRLDSGMSDVRIRYNRFEDNQDNTSTIFWTDASGSLPDPVNIQIVGNLIESAAPFAIKPQDPTIDICEDILIEGNTIIGAPAINLTTCTADNVIVRGNAGAKAWQSCSSATTWARNVWQHNVNIACGTDTWITGSANSTSALGLGGDGGFIPQTGSALLGAGPLTASCMTRDYFGTAPGSPNCNAGGVF